MQVNVIPSGAISTIVFALATPFDAALIKACAYLLSNDATPTLTVNVSVSCDLTRIHSSYHGSVVRGYEC